MKTLYLPLDPNDGSEFWAYWSKGLHGTPLYFRPFLEQYPRRVAGVIKAIARADAGGILVHCAGGRDRTQIITLVLLAFAGVAAEQIAADYALSHERPRPLLSRLGMEDHEQLINDRLAEWNTTAHREVVTAVEWLDTASAYLRAAGLTQDDLAALRSRLRCSC